MKTARRQWVLLALAMLAVAAVGVSGVAWAEDAPEGEEAPETERTESIRYSLKRGDRLVNLAEKYHVDVDAILEANKLRHARDLRAGQDIVIPPPGTETKRDGPVLPQQYRVRHGDNLSRLAYRFGVSVDDILVANDMPSPRALQADQEITIPEPGEAEKARQSSRGSRRAEPEERTGPEPAWMRRARKRAERLGLGSRRVARKLLRGNLERRWIRAAGRRRIPATLAMPVRGGWVGRGWGTGAGGYHRAVDIPGKIGVRVSSAASGIVAYADDDIPGFGKLVLIIHPGGLVTLYAHNSEFKTVPGERVKRGTRVALLGSSGISQGPHVHFEVLWNGQLCDPVPLFRPRARRKSGRPAVLQRELKVWPRRGGPPEGLKCGPRRRHPAYVGKPHGWRPADWGTRHRRRSGGGAREASASDDG